MLARVVVASAGRQSRGEESELRCHPLPIPSAKKPVEVGSLQASVTLATTRGRQWTEPSAGMKGEEAVVAMASDNPTARSYLYRDLPVSSSPFTDKSSLLLLPPERLTPALPPL